MQTTAFFFLFRSFLKIWGDFFSILKKIFNWKIALHQCFCHTTMQTSHNYYIPSPPKPPSAPPSHPSGPSQSSRLGSLCYIGASYYFTHDRYIFDRAV